MLKCQIILVTIGVTIDAGPHSSEALRAAPAGLRAHLPLLSSPRLVRLLPHCLRTGHKRIHTSSTMLLSSLRRQHSGVGSISAMWSLASGKRCALRVLGARATVGSQRKLPASFLSDAKTLDIPCVVPSSLETRKLRLPSGHHSKHPPPPVVLSGSQTRIQQYMCIRLFFVRVSCMCVSCFVIVSALCVSWLFFVYAALFFT